MVNFKKEHFDRMKELAIDMLINNESIATKLGQIYNVSDLMHLTTTESLNNIRLYLNKQITNIENKDEWVVNDTDSKYLTTIRKQKEFVNLVIGWKRYKLEQEDNKRKKNHLIEELNKLKESQKTPEEKIKELEEKIKSVEETIINING